MYPKVNRITCRDDPAIGYLHRHLSTCKKIVVENFEETQECCGVVMFFNFPDPHWTFKLVSHM